MRVRNYQLKNPFTDPPKKAAPAGGAELVREPVDMEYAPVDPYASSSRRVLSVTDLTRQIQALLEGTFANVWVEGEVSAPTVSSKGHMYFSLKDAQSLVKCMVWSNVRETIKFNVEQGMKVVCLGRISVYGPRGEYQLYVDRLEPKGIGALQLAFEQLQRKLEAEGLFNEARKRPLPAFPERIGVVTSPTGAAIQDILKILDHRLEVVLRPVRVQGRGAAEAVAAGIGELNRFDDLDLLIVGRGGGSLEDLWAFNEEAVARAIFHSRLPVISAVGHEKDVTIADLTADLRAPTPTKAAELVIAQRQACIDRFAALLEDPVFSQPEEWLNEAREQLEEFEQELVGTLRDPLLDGCHRLRVLHGDLMATSPQNVILHQAERLHRLHRTMRDGMIHSWNQAAAHWKGLAGRLSALSPLACLERGYSITFDSDGKIIKDAKNVRPGDTVETRLHRGRIVSRVESKHEDTDGD